MAPRRARDLVSSRRRTVDEGEDEDSNINAVCDDSMSETSVLSDENDDSDVIGSVISSTEKVDSMVSSPLLTTTSDEKTNGTANRSRHAAKARSSKAIQSKSSFNNTAATDAMLNGMQALEDVGLNDAIEFDDTFEQSEPQPTTIHPIASASRGDARRQRSQQQAKAKVSNETIAPPVRGGFFMHDQRSTANHQGFSIKGRGRGRAGPGVGPVTHSNSIPPVPIVQDRWNHDLHESVTNGSIAPNPKSNVVNQHYTSHPSSMSQPLSKSMSIGTVSCRVWLCGMTDAVVFEKMPVQQHTRLPDLRPPLRRDKPVRVAIPNRPPRYIFPSSERSFIFIPRAQRPNQQAGRYRGRGNLNQFGSRRNSIFGGSNYSASIAMSRRSSQRDGFISPAGSTASRPALSLPSGAVRPVVRLPAGAISYESAVSQSHNYPLPSQPAFQERRSSQIPMYQPRPQKTVAIANIEQPTAETIHAPQQQEQQPFHSQLPAQYAIQPTLQGQHMSYSHSHHGSQTAGASPFAGIPERAVDAQPFQPISAGQGAFYPPYQGPPMYFYPPADVSEMPYMEDQSMQSGYPPQQNGYGMPMYMPPPPQPPTPGQPGMFAYASNDMVYYYDQSQFQGTGEATMNSNYTMPGAGGTMTPGPDGYYYIPEPAPVAYYPQH